MVTGLSANIFESGMRGDLMMNSHTARRRDVCAGIASPREMEIQGTLCQTYIVQGEKEKSPSNPSMTERALQVWQARGAEI